MKTTKSIILVLFVLLTAQIASAYYCPSTGRWLSRDPISEPGFQALQTASSPSGIGNSVLQSSGRWVNRDHIGARPEKLIVSVNGNINCYEFNQNSPAVYFDFLGLNPILEFDKNCDNDEGRQNYLQHQYDVAMKLLEKASESSAFNENEKNSMSGLLASSKKIHVKCNDCILCTIGGKDNNYQGFGDATVVLCPGVFHPGPNKACWQVALLVELMKNTSNLPAGQQEADMRDDLSKFMCPK